MKGSSPRMVATVLAAFVAVGCGDDGETTRAQVSAATAVSMATAALDEIADGVCGTDITPGGAVHVDPIQSGAELRCESFTGHEGNVRVRGFSSYEGARATLGEPGPGDEVVKMGGTLLRIDRRRPECCPAGSLQDWSWGLGCWVVTGHSFDDTHLALAPQPSEVVAAMLESALFEELFSVCLVPDTSMALVASTIPLQLTAAKEPFEQTARSRLGRGT